MLAGPLTAGLSHGITAPSMIGTGVNGMNRRSAAVVIYGLSALNSVFIAVSASAQAGQTPPQVLDGTAIRVSHYEPTQKLRWPWSSLPRIWPRSSSSLRMSRTSSPRCFTSSPHRRSGTLRPLRRRRAGGCGLGSKRGADGNTPVQEPAACGC